MKLAVLEMKSLWAGWYILTPPNSQVIEVEIIVPA
jgi:hypothetical protein